MEVTQSAISRPAVHDSLAWWEDFQSAIVVIRAVQWFVLALTLFSVLGMGLSVYRFGEAHWGLWTQRFQDETTRQALQNAIILGWDLVHRVSVLVGIRVVGWLFMRLPIPDRLVLGWARDPEMRPNTAAWLLNEFKWQHRLNVLSVVNAHRRGKTEERGQQLIRERKGLSALSKRAQSN